MATIEIAFKDFQRLTSLRIDENDSYADVVRRILDQTDGSEPAPKIDHKPHKSSGGIWIKGAFLPDGTALSAYYANRTYAAQIEGGQWANEDGSIHRSASSAARAITNNNVNGLRFWSAKVPGSTVWRRLDTLLPS